MKAIKTTRKARGLYGVLALSYTVTSRELVWQVPMAARFRAVFLGTPSLIPLKPINGVLHGVHHLYKN